MRTLACVCVVLTLLGCDPGRVVDPEPSLDLAPVVFVEVEPGVDEVVSEPSYSVGIARPNIVGDVDRDALERFVKHKRSALGHCAARGQGTVEVRYLIGDRGELMHAETVSRTAPEAASRCVTETIAKWEALPRPTCSIVEVRQRFELGVDRR